MNSFYRSISLLAQDDSIVILGIFYFCKIRSNIGKLFCLLVVFHIVEHIHHILIVEICLAYYLLLSSLIPAALWKTSALSIVQNRPYLFISITFASSYWSSRTSSQSVYSQGWLPLSFHQKLSSCLVFTPWASLSQYLVLAMANVAVFIERER